MIKLFRDTDIGGSLSGGPDPIPEDVRKKIEDATDNYAFRVPYDGSNNFYDDAALKHFPKGAEFGYSLSLPTIQAQEERIRVLEEALKEIRDRGYTGAYMIAHEALIKAKALTPKTNKP